MDRRMDSTGPVELTRPRWTTARRPETTTRAVGADNPRIPFSFGGAALRRRRVGTTALVGVCALVTFALVQSGPRIWKSIAYRVLERSPVVVPSVGPEDAAFLDESFGATEYVVIEHRWTGEVFGEFRDAGGNAIGVRIVPESSGMNAEAPASSNRVESGSGDAALDDTVPEDGGPEAGDPVGP